MAVGPMVVSLTLKDNLSGAMKLASGAVSNAAGAMKGALSGVTSVLFSWQTAVVGLVSGVAVKAFVHAFAEQEAAVAEFHNTLVQTHRFTPQYETALTRLATTLEDVGVASAETILAQSKLLVLNATIASDVLPEAISVAVNLAARYRLDLATAMRIVTNASDGMVDWLSRYGIVIDAAVAKSGNFRAILATLGQAAGQANIEMRGTTLGALMALGVAWDNLKARIGSVIAIVLMKGGVLAAMQVLVTTFDRFIETASKTDVVATVLANLGRTIVSAMSTAVVWTGKLATFLVSTLPHAIIGLARSMADFTLDVIVPIGDGIAKVLAKIPGMSGAAMDMKGAMDKLASAAGNAYGPLKQADDAVTAFATSLNINGIVTDATVALDRLNNKIDAVAGDVAEKSKDVAAAIAAAAVAAARPIVQPTSRDEASVLSDRTLASKKSPYADASGNKFSELAKLQTAALNAVTDAQAKWNQSVDASRASADALAKIVPELRGQYIAFAAAAAAGVPGMATNALAIQQWSIQLTLMRETAATTASVISRAWLAMKKNFKPQQAELDAWGEFFGAIAKMAEKAYTVMADMGVAVVNSLNSFVDKAIDALFEGEIKNMRDLARIGKEILNDLAKEIMKIAVKAAIGAAVSAVFGARGGMWEAGAGFAPLPRYAMGGIASEPALIAGEAGREAIVPLPGAGRAIPVHFTGRGGDGSGGTTNVHIAIQALDGPSVESVLLSDDGQRAIHSAVVRGLGRSLRFRESVGGA